MSSSVILCLSVAQHTSHEWKNAAGIGASIAEAQHLKGLVSDVFSKVL